ncbi:FadR/GntR family transcriptional regulator [Paracoccus sp. S1E-3]|uniref:FadR/GntR family transcriptional regulator n=1 Tax=Paracoccus sp. S1E-3 TaxID=2756130 RepID=UPI0015EF4260|nr:FadR/GntR family transcriptional regulator [Paracoccus sp. S1E-3]MBA4491689.1 FadR family transcriptional regulator [Paracoccus sp. S1E-3]
MPDQSIRNDRAPAGPRRPRVLPDVVRSLAAGILSGRIEPGAALPREADLSVEYGVSRTVIREALKTLAAKGLVSIRSRVGTVVNDSDEWNIIDPQVLEWYGPDALDQRLQAAILETRIAIEPLIAELAAKRATLQEIANLEAAWRGMADAGADVAAFVQADIEFHQILYRTSHNPVFRQIGNMIDAALRSTLEVTATISPDQRAEAVRVHGELVEALRLRDPDAALKAANAILRLARRDLAASTQKTPVSQE